jgi:hypothetical protein
MSHLFYYGGNQEEEEEEEEENNVPPPGLDTDVCARIQALKWRIYDDTVLQPELHTPHAQDNGLLQLYVTRLYHLWKTLEDAKYGRVKEDAIARFPKQIQEDVAGLVKWAEKFFKENGPSTTIPYVDYLQTSLKVYPYVHQMDVTKQ